MIEEKVQSSAGHKLGQLVGDWFQDYFVKPLLQEVAGRLGLFLDHRACIREKGVRGEKIIWADEDRNAVDYDFVMELNGSAQKLGIPVAFLECFWRRGSRHSKDKARDDSGKLMPMRAVQPRPPVSLIAATSIPFAPHPVASFPPHRADLLRRSTLTP